MKTFLEFLSESIQKPLVEDVHPEIHDVLLHHGFFRTPDAGSHTVYRHHSGALALADSRGNWAIGHKTLESGDGSDNLRTHLKNAGINGKHSKGMAA